MYFIYVAPVLLCLGVLGHVKIETQDLAKRMYNDIPPKGEPWGNQCNVKNGKVLGEIHYHESPPIIIRCFNGAKIMNDTEIAFSKFGNFETGLTFSLGFVSPRDTAYLWFRRPNSRYINLAAQYEYVYLRNITQPKQPERPAPRWDSENSIKIGVKDLKNKMKAVPKTIRCNNNYLKDLRYDGVNLGIWCSDTRQRYVRAKMVLNDYEPMFETTIVLTDGELVFQGVDGSYWSLEPYTFIYVEKEKN